MSLWLNIIPVSMYRNVFMKIYVSALNKLITVFLFLWKKYWLAINNHGYLFYPSRSERLDDIVEYLDITWGKVIKKNFLSEITRCLKLISITPDLFPLFEDSQEVRQCLITYYNTMYYRVKNNQIQILTIWDNRMDPQTLKFILSEFD